MLLLFIKWQQRIKSQRRNKGWFEIINDFLTSDFVNWFQLIGAVFAFILIILTIWKFWKERVSLSINLEQKIIESDSPNQGIKETEITITADITNKGLEPTTISGATFYSDYKDLNNIKVDNSSVEHESLQWYFEEIRLRPNDRKEVNLHIYSRIKLPKERCKINGKIVFRTAKKEVSKEVVLEYDGGIIDFNKEEKK